MLNLLTLLTFQPWQGGSLGTKADITTTSEKRQTPPIGNIARMVLGPHERPPLQSFCENVPLSLQRRL
jgi:hypothetical protein